MDSGWTKTPGETAIEQAFIYIRAYVTIPLICIGIFGNGMSVLIFIQTRKSKDSASVQYLSALAVSDTMNLVLYGLTEWFRSGARDASNETWSFEILATNTVLCKTCRYLSFISFHLSSWIIVTFAGERLIAVWFPLKSTRLITSGRRRRVIILLVLSTIVMKLPYLCLYEIHSVRPNTTATCFYDENKWQYGYLYIFIDFFLASFLPCVLLCLVNFAITIGVLKSKKALENRSTAGHELRRAMENKCIVNLLIVSSLFVILETPYVVVWMAYFVMSRPKQSTPLDEDYVYFIFNLAKLFSSFKMINYSMNFIVYTLSLDFYRRKFNKLLCCCCPNRLEITTFPKISSFSNNQSSVNERRKQSAKCNHLKRLSNASTSSSEKCFTNKSPAEFELCSKYCCSLYLRRNVARRSSSITTQNTAISNRNGSRALPASASCNSLISRYDDWDRLSNDTAETADTPIRESCQKLSKISENEINTQEVTENNRTFFITKF